MKLSKPVMLVTGSTGKTEAGGPEWLTWRQIADIIGEKTGRKIRIIPLPAWLARLNQVLATPFSKPAANIFALMNFVASYEPRWDSAPVVRCFHLPKQLTVLDYLDANFVGCRSDHMESET